MKRLTCVLIPTLLLMTAACGDDTQYQTPDELTKEQARQLAENDRERDFCAEFEWYGDGVCDDFCLEPDPDCQDDGNNDDNNGVDCPTIYAPVCGTDGMTYGNECAADVAGVDVAYEGECDDRPGDETCATDDDCGRAQFCRTDVGVCGENRNTLGVCANTDEDCPAIYAPVCGCDGQTYGNECTAHSAGVNVASEGECDGGDPPAERQCGARLGDTCERGEYCHFELRDSCGATDLPGVCRPRPDVCSREYAPVCGCDGETYSNECNANAAGTSAAASGECDAEPGEDCATDDDCGRAQFCRTDVGVCGENINTLGVCTDRPEFCTEEYAPVCGCDGQTYSNDCFAAGAGVNIASEGECDGGDPPAERQCGARLGDTCERGEYCHFELRDRCGATDLPGVCRPRPNVCTEEFAPVCGCDGETYSNECNANAAGTSAAASGECD